MRDLEQIRTYIARDNRSAAEAFYPVLQRSGARFVVMHPYLIIYRIMEQSRTVRVLRYWHGVRERVRMGL